jgi:hypothetical protein
MKTSPMVLLLLLTVSLPLSLEAEAQWQELKPPYPVTFSVLMPGKPEKVAGDKSEWRSLDHQGNVYSVSCGLYTQPRIDDPNAWMLKTIQALARSTHSKVAYQNFFKYQKVPACEFKLVNMEDHRVAVTRYFLVKQWFYFLDYVATKDTLDVKPMERFFNSFQIINAQLKDFD